MTTCKSCSEEVSNGNLLGCDGCGALFCRKCAEKTKMICPHCYSSLEIKG